MQACSKIYRWINHYLENITARTNAQGQSSIKMVLEQGVPQGEVLIFFVIYGRTLGHLLISLYPMKSNFHKANLTV